MVSITSSLDCRFSKFYFVFQSGVVTCVSENVVYAIKCHACHKIYIEETGRRLGERFREHLHSTKLPDSDLRDGRHSDNSGHSGFCSPFGFQECQRHRRSFEARVIFIHRTLPTPWWFQCGLWFHIKSAHAVNVAIFVFISALCCKRIYQFFWNHWWRESTLETFGSHLKF